MGEVAVALQAQRPELLGSVRTRADARGLPQDLLEEIVSEAICVVAMMRRPIMSEEHLMGAFWTAVRLLLRHQREGRNSLRVGSRQRVWFEPVAVRARAEEPGPEQLAELKDRVARAADFVAQLSEFERRVIAVMAVRGTGAKLTARALGVSVKAVRAAERTAEAKLERIAAIAAAGRMCDYRESAIAAYASGHSEAEDERLARAHLAACAPCRSAYARMTREMRSREFQRGAAAAFLPAPALLLGHHLGLLGRMLGWTADRPIPAGGPGERAAEILGGAGVAKAAAAGGTVVLATATLAGGIHSLVMPSTRHPPPHLRRSHMAVRHMAPVQSVGVSASGSVAQSPASTARQPAPHLTAQQHAELEFSSLRSSPSNATSPSPTRAPAATAASVRASSASSAAGLERSEPSAIQAEAPVHSGPSQAAREFGQP